MTEHRDAGVDQAALLQCLLDLTEAIRDASMLADWQRAAQLAEQRSPLLSMLSTEQTPANLDVIRRIQAIDATLMGDATAARHELECEYREMTRQVSAANQYHRVAML
ncbi:flagellar protein FliT [Burkholderia sp. MR1-5-21]